MIRTTTIQIESRGFGEAHDLTTELRRFLAETGVREGTALVFVPGSTAGVTTIEFERGALQDLARIFEETAPADGHYARLWASYTGAEPGTETAADGAEALEPAKP